MAAPRKLSDPRSLRAIAHPVRSRLMYELYARGRARAVDLAAAIDVPANAVSFHLRELARYGLIEEAPDPSRDGRDRWWRPISDHGLNWKVDEFDESGKAIAQVWRRHAAARVHALIDRVFLAIASDDEPNVFLNQNDVPMLLTEDEVREMSGELGALLFKWNRHGQEQQEAGDQEGRQTYLTLTYTVPQGFLDE